MLVSGEKLLRSLKEWLDLVLLIAKKNGTCVVAREYKVIPLLYSILR